MTPQHPLWPHAVRLDQIRPYRNNPYTHAPKQVELLLASLCQYGWVAPGLGWRDMELVAGHGRFLAAKLARERGLTIPGWPDSALMPVIFLPALSPEQVRAYRLADNELARMAGRDDDRLRQELTALAAVDFDLSLTGLDLGLLGDLAGVEPPPQAEKPKPEPKARGAAPQSQKAPGAQDDQRMVMVILNRQQHEKWTAMKTGRSDRDYILELISNA